jgi:pimeloyl-ACP methyl ester carboxylesterase
MSPFLSRLLASAAVLAIAACSTPLRPDLARLYGVGTGPGDTTPVIVIPGLFGSKLRSRTTGVEVWPGTWSDVLWGDYRGLAVDFDPVTLAVRGDDIEAYDLADSVLGHDIYRPIIDTLQRFGGYVRATPGTRPEPGERRFYVFPYDWRQDNVVHARELEALIDTIRRDYGNPDLRVDIVAHSMGGLIARYYLRYGTVDVLESGSDELVTLYGTTRVRKLILLGTPNMGSAGSLHAFIGGESIGFGRIPTEVLATIPSGYQLFPHPLVTWLIDAQGRGLYEDLFSSATWRRFGWSVYSPAAAKRLKAARGADADAYLEALRRYFDYRLERGRRFMWMLSTPEPATPIRYVLFGGDCTLTPARLALEEDDGRPAVRLYPGDIVKPVPGVPYDELMLEPGDGRVTKPSLLARETLDPMAPQSADSFLPVAYWFFLCEHHDQLTSNNNFQDNLLNVLLTRSLPWEMTK